MATIKDSTTGHFYEANYGVGFGGQGFWGNRHFLTLSEAQAFFDEQYAACVDAFSRGGKKSVVKDVRKGDPCTERWTDIVRNVTITNIKKDGTPGKMQQTVRLYTL